MKWILVMAVALIWWALCKGGGTHGCFLTAAVCVLAALSLAQAAAREDDRMGIRFDGNGRKEEER